MLYVLFGLQFNIFKSFLCYLKDDLIPVWRECEFIFCITYHAYFSEGIFKFKE